MVVHAVHHFVQVVACECLEEIAVAHIARREPPSVLLDVAKKVVDDRLSLPFGYHVQEEGQGVATLACGAVLGGFGIEIGSIEGLTDLVGQLCIMLFIGCVSRHGCRLHQVAQSHVVVSRSNQPNGGVARESGTEVAIVVPVAQTEINQMPLGTRREVVDPATHRGVVGTNQMVVAIGFVVHEGSHDDRDAPLGGVVEGIHAGALEDDVVGGGGRNHAVGTLCIGNITHHLRQVGRQVVVVQQPRAVQMHLLQPAELLTVGAVGPDGLHVAAHGMVDQPMGGVENRIRRLEFGHLLGLVMHKAGVDLLDHGQRIGILHPGQYRPFEQDVAESVVGESRMPCFCSLAFECIGVIVLTACLTLLRGVAVGRCLSHDERDLCSALSPHGNLGEAGHVLSHVEQQRRRVDRALGLGGGSLDLLGGELMYLLRRITTADADRWCLLGCKYALRSLLHDNRLPCRGIEVGAVPSGLLEAGIVILASVNRVKGNRA